MKNREPRCPAPPMKRAGEGRRAAAGPLSPAKRADLMRTTEAFVAQAEDAVWVETHHFRTCDLCTAVMTLRAREARLAYEADSTPRCHDCCFTAPNHAPDCAERRKSRARRGGR